MFQLLNLIAYRIAGFGKQYYKQVRKPSQDWCNKEADTVYFDALEMTRTQLIAGNYLPLVFHEDGVPNWHDASATFWSFSVPCSAIADSFLCGWHGHI